MAKKKGKKKGSGKGPTSNLELKRRIGASGMKQVGEIQKKYPQDVVLMASRSFPKLPAATEKLLRELPENEARDIRKKLLTAV